MLGLGADLSASPDLLEFKIIVELALANSLEIFKVFVVLQSKHKLRSGLRSRYLFLHLGESHTDGALLVYDLSESVHTYPIPLFPPLYPSRSRKECPSSCTERADGERAQ